MKIAFVVPGKPVGKGRPRASTVGGHVHMHTPESTVTYENWVRACYLQNHVGVRLEGQLTMELTAIFEPPKRLSKQRRAACLAGLLHPTGKPDLDNLAKAAADALNGLAYRDDSCITDLVVRKRYGTEPRLEVVIRDAAEPAPVEIQPEKREEEWF